MDFSFLFMYNTATSPHHNFLTQRDSHNALSRVLSFGTACDDN